MISEAGLKEALRNNDLLPIRYLVNANSQKLFVLDIGFEEYLEFIKYKKADIVFYKYLFYDFRKYLITEKTIDSVDIELNDELKEKIEKYNDDIKNLDLERPYKLTCFIETENVCYSIVVEDNWLEGQGKIKEPEIALISMLNSYDTDDPDEIYNNYLNEETEKFSTLVLETKKQIVNFLLTDNKFKMCTNQSLRNSYAITLEESRPDFAVAFYGKNGYYERHKAYSALEIVYRCIKSGMTNADEIVELIP